MADAASMEVERISERKKNEKVLGKLIGTAVNYERWDLPWTANAEKRNLRELVS